MFDISILLYPSNLYAKRETTKVAHNGFGQ